MIHCNHCGLKVNDSSEHYAGNGEWVCRVQDKEEEEVVVNTLLGLGVIPSQLHDPRIEQIQTDTIETVEALAEIVQHNASVAVKDDFRVREEQEKNRKGFEFSSITVWLAYGVIGFIAFSALNTKIEEENHANIRRLKEIREIQQIQRVWVDRIREVKREQEDLPVVRHQIEAAIQDLQERIGAMEKAK